MKNLIALALALYSSIALASLDGGGLMDFQGNGVSSNLFTGTRNPLDIEVILSGSIIDPRSIRALTSGTDSISCTQGTSPWVENITQFGGSALSTGTGASGSGIPRVTVANDSNILVTQSTSPWVSNVTQFGSSNVATGTGAGGSGIPRVTVSNDSTVGLVAGSAIIGNVRIDQTTPGTTNAVQANAGTNLNTSALNLEATQSAFKTANHSDLIATQPRNVAQVNGVTVSTGTGVSGTGTQRVTLAADGQKTMANSTAIVFSSDQTGINTFQDKSGTGTISALNGLVSFSTNGMSTLDISAQGTFTATLQVQGQAGDSAWVAVIGYVPGSGNTSTVLTGASNLIFPIGGFNQVRIIAIAYTSGTANIQYNLGSGTQGQQVFNLFPASLQATITGSGSAGTPATGVVSIQGIASGTVVPGNVTQLGGNAINTGAGATGTGTQRVVSNGNDGSGNSLTSTLITGTAANKQPLDVINLSSGTGKYFTSFSTQQTAATAANASIFAMRNAAASTKTVIFESVYCRQGFNATNPVTRTQEGYIFQRFSAATPTGGTALTAGLGDSSDSASQVTDIRFLDTGLTTTSVTFVANSLAEIACDTTQGIECNQPILSQPSAWKLAPGEGLVMRLSTATVTGVTISCHFGWREQ